jgi:hypothetical protein
MAISTGAPPRTHRQTLRRSLLITMVFIVPALVMRFAGLHPNPVVALVIYGAAVVSASFVLALAAEAAQIDVSGGLAIAVLALIAVLPEYAVDLYYAYTAGHDADSGGVRLQTVDAGALMPAVEDEVGGAPRHRHGGAIGVAGQHDRHDREVDHAKAVDAPYAELVVDHVVRVRSHAARTDGVVARRARDQGRVDEFVVRLRVDAGRRLERDTLGDG